MSTSRPQSAVAIAVVANLVIFSKVTISGLLSQTPYTKSALYEAVTTLGELDLVDYRKAKGPTGRMVRTYSLTEGGKRFADEHLRPIWPPESHQRLDDLVGRTSPRPLVAS